MKNNCLKLWILVIFFNSFNAKSQQNKLPIILHSESYGHYFFSPDTLSFEARKKIFVVLNNDPYIGPSLYGKSTYTYDSISGRHMISTGRTPVWFQYCKNIKDSMISDFTVYKDSNGDLLCEGTWITRNFNERMILKLYPIVKNGYVNLPDTVKDNWINENYFNEMEGKYVWVFIKNLN